MFILLKPQVLRNIRTVTQTHANIHIMHNTSPSVCNK